MFVGHRLQLPTPSTNPVCQDLEASFILTKLPTSSFTATVSPGKPGHQLIRCYSFTTPTQAMKSCRSKILFPVETDGECSDVSSGLHLSWWLLLHPQYWTQADMEWSKQGLQGKVQLCSHKYFMHYKHNEHEVLLFLPNGRFKGTLASVVSQADMDWLWDFGGRKPFWIGTCPVLTCVSKCNAVVGVGSSFACNAL